MATNVPTLTLNNGVTIPQLGFGTYQVPPEQTADTVTKAFEAGYRHIDTATAYRNEAEVGQAFRASGLDRDDVFITTKCFNDDHGYESARTAFKTSLDRLDLEFVDLYLIHWPVPAKDLYADTWRAFVELREEGLVRSIGVSNFQAPHLERIVSESGVTPSVNQIELHPYLQQAGLRREHADRGIVTEAWSPLAQGAVLDDPEIVRIAQAAGKTAGQVVLRWHLQLGNVVFPKSSTPARIEENFDLFDFELADEQMAALERLDRGERIGPDPDTFVRPRGPGAVGGQRPSSDGKTGHQGRPERGRAGDVERAVVGARLGRATELRHRRIRGIDEPELRDAGRFVGQTLDADVAPARAG